MIEPMAVRVSEAARLIGVSKSTILLLIKQGKLESRKLGDEQRATRLVIFASIKKLLGQEA